MKKCIYYYQKNHNINEFKFYNKLYTLAYCMRVYISSMRVHEMHFLLVKNHPNYLENHGNRNSHSQCSAVALTRAGANAQHFTSPFNLKIKKIYPC